jgi:thiamine monophosphate synthase
LAYGVSIHTPGEGANAAGAAWVMAGNVFETASHPNKPGMGLPFVRTVVQMTPSPVIAVGGIRPEHVAPILRLGAIGVAVIAGIWNERTPKNAALRYLSFYGDGIG